MMPDRKISGILNLNKPQGQTSHRVIARLRKFSGEQRIGHTGTLDPMASGVLPVLFGQATRISRFLSAKDKAYLAVVELGITTDTYDGEGKIIRRKDYRGITRAEVEAALQSFRGSTEQVPPLFSAIKYKGKHYYELARKGVDLQPRTRRVYIHSLELVSFELPLLSLSIECGSGTYIRSLAHDLGGKLGPGGHLKALTRTRSGIFRIEEAVSLPQVEAACREGSWLQLLHPPDYAMKDWDEIALNAAQLKMLRDGLSISLPELVPDGRPVRAYDADGQLAALLKHHDADSGWKHEVLFNS
jgi:tRNA pseudouridine55 synthase